MSSIPSIIIPAHNEESVIYSTLSVLSPEENTDHFKVVVVCNGCTDNTLDIIKNNFPSVLCLATPKPSKALAIRYAETQVNGFPRIYLDADIKLSASGAKKLIKESKRNPKNLVLPRSKVNLSKTSLLVSLYYKYWYQTPFVKQLGYGCGMYALSEVGRNSFGEWPNLISDDGYIRQLFEAEQVQIIDDVYVGVIAPKTLSGLIKIKTRSKYGSLELKDYLRSNKASNKKIKQPFKPILTSPLAFMSYFWVNVISKCKAQQMYKRNNFTWLRDDSSRMD